MGTRRREKGELQLKRRTILFGACAVAIIAIYLNNSSSLAEPLTAKPLLLAHRGVHADFPHAGLTADTCTASRIFPPQNHFIEDTIPSMREAFKDGADIVELDIHPTIDGDWAVFHDWTLECRTNGQGVTRKQTLAYLKSLDIGYGYTADGGKTFPLRGFGVGLLPSLDEVLNSFPENSFLIHIKSNSPAEGTALAQKLNTVSAERRKKLMIYGAERPVDKVRSQLPDARVMSVKIEKACLLRYIAFGWSGFVPNSCRHSLLLLPANYAPWLWGWPNKFLRRMDRVGTSVFVADDYQSSGSKGLNTLADLDKLPAHYSGGIWTDSIEVIGPTLRRTQ